MSKVRVVVERPGWDWCEHTWRSESYNDWGLPYYVARCTNCGRCVSSPSVDVCADDFKIATETAA